MAQEICERQGLLLVIYFIGQTPRLGEILTSFWIQGTILQV